MCALVAEYKHVAFIVKHTFPRMTVLPAEAKSKPTAPVSRGACPVASCRGTLDGDWTCRLCSAKRCDQCFEQIGAQGGAAAAAAASAAHVCDPDVLASVKLATQEGTKRCPNPACGVPIERTQGCSDMFCVACKTGFNWVLQG